MAGTSEETEETGDSNGGGQVSDVENLTEGADTPIADDQAVAGYPDSESGSPDEGPAGPNANTNEGDSTGEPRGDQPG